MGLSREAEMTKSEKLDRIWDDQHPAFRELIDGERVIMIIRGDDYKPIKLTDLTDKEIKALLL